MWRVDAIGRAAAFAGLAAASSILLDADSTTQTTWRRIDSPNFVVVGEARDGELREVAVKFEAFREVLGRVLNTKLTSTIVPTVITVFGSDRSFTPFKPVFKGKRVEAAGLFVGGRDANHIVLVNDDSPGRFSVVFHEYTHLLISNSGQRVPVWLNEGLAEYYSTFAMGSGGRYAEIGDTIGSHLQLAGGLTVLPLSELLSVTEDSPLYNEGNRRSVFYAKSWALTHFILQSQPTLMPQLFAYMAELSRGVPSVQAWQTAFGKQDVAGDLDRYIRRGTFTATQYRFTDRVAGFEGPAISVGAADVQAYQADLLLQLDQPADAAGRLAQAAKLEPDSPWTRVVRARMAVEQGHFDRALELRTLAPTGDWYLDYLAGVVLAAAAEGRQFPPGPEELQAARRFLGPTPGRPELPNAIARLVALEIYSSTGPSKATLAAIERARSQAPGRHDYALLHAQVLARLSEFAAARMVLGPLITPAYPANIRDAARSLMGRIVELETGPARIDSSGTITRPAVREVRPGEQRIEGVLEAIECGAGGSATFLVRSGADIARVTAARLTDVDFIAYRSDFKGRVECGPLKPALPVYVTWRAGAAAGSKIAVAIEFLPK